MHRQQPVIAARWRRLWLLLTLAVTALGLWSGGHCADGHPAHPDAAVVAFGGTVVASLADADPRNITSDPAAHEQPSAADGACHVRTSWTIAYAPAPVAVTPVVRGHGRISADSRRQPVQPAPAAIALSAIGVSRT